MNNTLRLNIGVLGNGGGSTPAVAWTPATALPEGAITPTAWMLDGVDLYTDAAKTTPAGNSDLIYVWGDQSGNGNDLVNPTEARRPTYTTATNTIDGAASRYLYASISGLSRPITVISAMIIPSDAANFAMPLSNFNSDWGFNYYSSTPAVSANSGAELLVTVENDALGVLTGVFNGASSSVNWHSATANNSNTGTTGDGELFAKLQINGRSTTATTTFKYREVLLYPAVVSANDLATIKTYLETRLGINFI